MSRKPKLTIQEVKTCLRARAVLHQAGLGDLPIKEAAIAARHTAIAQRGLRRYLFEMLGQAGNLPAKDCRFVLIDGNLVSPNGSSKNIALVDYLVRHYTAETLPTAVLAATPGEMREFVL